MARLTLPTLLLLTAIVTILPFAAMVLVAFAPDSGQTFPGAFNPSTWTFENFAHVLSSSNIPRWTLNSLLYSLISVVA
ncbi:carbohydrate ABC transporter permease, partial [Kribbella sandramycini]|nr:carbohydrate ABC transporter permease [Kribbella sandramycini]